MISVCRDTLYPNINVYVKGWALIEPAGYRLVSFTTLKTNYL